VAYRGVKIRQMDGEESGNCRMERGVDGAAKRGAGSSLNSIDWFTAGAASPDFRALVWIKKRRK
jgi:hypothetical protein